MKAPVLAVVGHPNKGKSSIVATLAHDASVPISSRPGTTTRTRFYPAKVDDELLYTLADTPGFQRARRVLEWLHARDVSTDSRAEAVRDFVRTHREDGAFVDECELLAPIVDGAGILYVVDGSKPYGPEYEAEMEVLRWTGRPRMALVNPIGSQAHVEAWRNALGQYFSVVRVFDAVAADFARQVALLSAFGTLEESWREPFARAVELLSRDRARRHALAARAIADSIAQMLSLVLETDVEPGVDDDEAAAGLEEELRARLRSSEAEARRAVERIYDHDALERDEPAVDPLVRDLFDERTWTLFGLTPSQLAVTGALGGAMVGGGVDVALGGASLLLGSALGAALGAASAWFGGGHLAAVSRDTDTPLGGTRIRVGPVKSVNFPYVVLGRALHHQRLVAARTHANRAPLAIDAEEGARYARETQAPVRDRLEPIFRSLRDGDDGAVDRLAALLETLTPALDRAPADAAASADAPGSSSDDHSASQQQR